MSKIISLLRSISKCLGAKGKLSISVAALLRYPSGRRFMFVSQRVRLTV